MPKNAEWYVEQDLRGFWSQVAEIAGPYVLPVLIALAIVLLAACIIAGAIAFYRTMIPDQSDGLDREDKRKLASIHKLAKQ